ncbi:DUF1513 domain-containing protein [Tropicimonas sp. IMCC34043]|uniref:DUF1513 domain-containing protein n=1 Tax=Tropicimonas sp. IMCC34043 TaxID=2248760 RepID=UPI000E260D19|nr:DUF1513 domain-containing protein [Tropicimonas sp. IMCC34043]
MRRRHFLAASTAALLATPSWAEIGAPRYVTAAARPDKSTWIVGLDAGGTVLFSHPVPGRGHAAALHPDRAEAVTIARRPGTFADVVDCATGKVLTRLQSPEERHFYGHGAFTADGRYLLTTENAWEIPDGRLGVWDAANGYARVDEIPSGGIGPHEMLRLPDGNFAIANGGIQTRPESERAKLNLPTMQSNLTYMSPEGEILEQVAPEPAMRLNAIRHLATDTAGGLAIGLQWQGNPLQQVPLVATHRRGEALRLHDHPHTAMLKQYAGSIAFTRDRREIVVTGPFGDAVLFFDAATGAPLSARSLPVAAGAAVAPEGIAITVAGGLQIGDSRGTRFVPVPGDWSWDNHLVPIG